MILVFGGAFNGKLEFVQEKFKIAKEDIFFCRDEKINYDKKVICGLHIFIRACVVNNINSVSILKSNEKYLKDKIIICDEINSGIVPIEKIYREWREETGQAMQLLSQNSDSIYRIFFGIGEKLK